jgi:hypothetical protein
MCIRAAAGIATRRAFCNNAARDRRAIEQRLHKYLISIFPTSFVRKMRWRRERLRAETLMKSSRIIIIIPPLRVPQNNNNK